MPLIERLPWEQLELERPIWRLDGHGARHGLTARRGGVRCPRLLLLVGQEEGLNLDGDIAVLERLDRQGRIALRTLRGPASNLSGLRTALGDRQGWDVLVFLGHSAGDPQGGGRLQLGDGHWLGGRALAQELEQSSGHRLALVLLNSCSGMDLARCCTDAGIPWALCFREVVPTRAASLAFSQLLAAMEKGLSFAAALEQVRQALSASGPMGCELLLSAMCTGNATELLLPLSRRRQFRLRLAASSPARPSPPHCWWAWVWLPSCCPTTRSAPTCSIAGSMCSASGARPPASRGPAGRPCRCCCSMSGAPIPPSACSPPPAG